MDRRLFVLGALAAAGCAGVAPVPGTAPSAETYPELETVTAQATREGLRLTVASSGCTGRSDWAVWREVRSGAVALAFARRRLDPCRGLPGGTAELVFSWAELGVRPGGRVVILNPQAPAGRTP
jgi:hypothetical protein